MDQWLITLTLLSQIFEKAFTHWPKHFLYSALAGLSAWALISWLMRRLWSRVSFPAHTDTSPTSRRAQFILLFTASVVLCASIAAHWWLDRGG